MSLKEEIDAIIFRCFAQGQYWGTEQDGKLNPDYKPEHPIDRSEALDQLFATISKHLPEKPLYPETMAYVDMVKKASENGKYDDMYDNGWNAYQSEVNKLLKGE